MTLEAFNQKRLSEIAEQRQLDEPHPNGIDCPECGAPLWDTNPRQVLLSNPAQKNIHCPACKWRGLRYA